MVCLHASKGIIKIASKVIISPPHPPPPWPYLIEIKYLLPEYNDTCTLELHFIHTV